MHARAPVATDCPTTDQANTLRLSQRSTSVPAKGAMTMEGKAAANTTVANCAVELFSRYVQIASTNEVIPDPMTERNWPNQTHRNFLALGVEMKLCMVN